MPSKKYRPTPIQIDELTSIENEAVDGDVWNEVTNGFSRTTIENLICLYSSPEEQTQLLEIIENHCSNSASKSNKAKFTAIRNGIIDGKYKRPDIDNDPEYSEGMELTYKEELEEFKARYKFMEEGYKRKIENLSYAYREDLSEIKKKLEKKALRRELKDDPSIRLFTFTEYIPQMININASLSFEQVV